MSKPETVALHIYIRKDLKKKLWEYITKTYESPRFHMREVIEQALEEFLQKHGET